MKGIFKMKGTKRIFAVVLAILLLFTALPLDFKWTDAAGGAEITSVTINLGDTYTNIKYTVNGGIEQTASDGSSFTVSGTIDLTDKVIAITAEKNGITYSASVTVDSSNKSTTMNATNYTLSITNSNSSTIKYKKDSENYSDWNASVTFDSSATYYLQITAGSTYKIVNFSAVTAANYSIETKKINNNIYSIEVKITGDPGAITISESAPAVTDVIISQGGSEVSTITLIPTVASTLTCGFTYNYTTTDGSTFNNLDSKISTSFSVTENSSYYTISGNSITLNENYTNNKGDVSVDEKLKVSLSSTDITLRISSKELSIALNIGNVVYGTDFKLTNSTGTEAECYAKDDETFYYNDSAYKFIPLDATYSSYSYKTNSGSWSNFDSITTSSSVSLSNSPLYVRMKTDTTYGESASITLIQDTTAPTLTFDTTGLQEASSSTASNRIYIYNSDTTKTLTAADNQNGSGVEGIYYSETANNTSGTKVTGNIFDCFGKSESAETLYFFAMDYVGNKSDEIKITAMYDAGLPEIEISDRESRINLSDEKYYISLSSPSAIDSDTVTFTISDTNLYSASVKVSNSSVETLTVNNDTAKYDLILSNDSTYTVVVNASDGLNSVETTYTIVVDSKAPVVTSFYAVPYENSDYGVIGYNSDSILSLEFTDENIDTSEAAVIMFDDETFENLSISGSGTYSGSAYFAGSNITEGSYTEAYVTVKDLAGNTCDAYYLKDADTSGSDVKNFYVVQNEITLSNLGFDIYESTDNTNNYIKTTGGEFTGTLTYSGATYVNEDFVKLYYKLDDGDYSEVDSKYYTLDTSTSGTIKISLSTDFNTDNGEYTFKVAYCDIAVNDTDKIKNIESATYTYDTTLPVLKITPTAKNSEGAVILSDGLVTFELIETNPDFASFSFALSGSTNEGSINLNSTNGTLNGTKDALNNIIDDNLKDVKGWVKGTGSYTAVVGLPEGNYTLSEAKVKDYSLNENTNKSPNIKFVYDVTAPEIDSVTVDNDYDSTNKDYSEFDDSKAVVTVDVYELVSSKVTVTTKLKDNNTGKNTTQNATITKNSNGIFTTSITISKNFKGTISFTLKDGNGNTTTKDYDYSNGIVVEHDDMHASSFTGSITELNSNQALNGIYNEDVNLKISVSDTYSGIKSLSYKINGVETKVSLNQNGNIITNTQTLNATIKATHANEGNEIPVSVTVVDNAGHTSTITETYAIDITDPVIDVTYNSVSPSNETYYNQTRTATITVKDYNFYDEGVTISVTRDGTRVNVTPNFHSDGTVRKDANGVSYKTYVMTYDFAQDGDYEFSVSVTDKAGNSSKTDTDKFTVDKTNPTMSLTYNKNNAYSGNYYGEARIATLTIVEHNFDANSIQISVTASKDGATVSSPSISSFTSSGDVHKCTISFTQDADYTISVTGKDLADNSADSIATQSFTVDLTAPEITITSVTGNATYSGSVTPVVEVTDINYNSDGVSIQVVGGANGVIDLGRSEASVSHGQTFTLADIAHTLANDDIYTLTVKAVDRAGHETVETVTYKVNRFGSQYSLNDTLSSAVERYYTVGSDDFVIYEKNVDELKNYTVTYTIDNEIVTLEEGVGFTVSHSVTDDGWNLYEYRFDPSIFTEEGVYILTISSEDESGQLSDNNSKDVIMKFCIDLTAPTLIISGVEDGQEIEKDLSANIVIEAFDNNRFESMTVMLNGELIMTEEDLVDNKLSFTVDPEKGDQVLLVTCYDAAGNETVQEIHFTFDTGIMHGNWWIWIIIIIALLIIFFIIFLIKKRKEEKDGTQTIGA